MNDERLKEFQKKIEEVAKEYNVSAAAFTGTHSGSKTHYLGFAVGKMSLLTMFECALNVGRLWQHMRTIVRGILDEFEKTT